MEPGTVYFVIMWTCCIVVSFFNLKNVIRRKQRFYRRLVFKVKYTFRDFMWLIENKSFTSKHGSTYCRTITISQSSVRNTSPHLHDHCSTTEQSRQEVAAGYSDPRLTDQSLVVSLVSHNKGKKKKVLS